MRIDAMSLHRLRELNSLIHDLWFDLDKVKFDEQTGMFTLHFGKRHGTFGRRFTVTKVRCCHWSDTEQIGIYWINKVIIRMHEERIVIDCDILQINLWVGPGFEIYADEEP